MFALCVMMMTVAMSTSAQSIWINPTDNETHVSLEWARSEFDSWDELNFFTSAFYLSGRVAVADRVRVVGELPISYYNATNRYTDKNSSEVVLGNPYLGMEVGRIGNSTWGELGVRFPVAPTNNEAVYTGFYSDYDRCEAFMADVMSITAIGNYQLSNATGFTARLRGGPAFLIDTGNVQSDEVEVYGIYSLQGWYDAAPLRVGANVTGRILASEKDLDLGERTTHQVGLSIIGRLDNFEPGVHVRAPLDSDLNNILDYGFGLSLTVPINR